MPLAAQPNTRVGVVNATAEAGAEPLSYKLMQGPSTFSVTEHTGEIFLKQQLTVASSIQLTIAGAFLCVCVFVSLCVSLCVSVCPCHDGSASVLGIPAVSVAVQDSRAECLTLKPGDTEITVVPSGCVTETHVTINVST